MVEFSTPVSMLKVQICYASPERQILRDMELSVGTTIHQVIQGSGILREVAEIDLSVWRVGIYGKLKTLETEVRDHDRIEIYRPLKADPMESRRRRASKRPVGAEV